jgi:hypothetical protein
MLIDFGLKRLGAWSIQAGHERLASPFEWEEYTTGILQKSL